MPKGNTIKIATLTANLVTDKTAYLALYTSNPGGNNSGTEVVYSGYERRPITFGTPGINGAVAEIKNTNLIEFATVPSSSGSAAHVAVLDALTGGNLLYYAAIGVTYTLEQGVKPTVPIGSLTIYES